MKDKDVLSSSVGRRCVSVEFLGLLFYTGKASQSQTPDEPQNCLKTLPQKALRTNEHGKSLRPAASSVCKLFPWILGFALFVLWDGRCLVRTPEYSDEAKCYLVCVCIALLPNPDELGPPGPGANSATTKDWSRNIYIS